MQQVTALILGIVFEDPARYREQLLQLHVPPPLNASYVHRPRDEVIACRVSRFHTAEAGNLCSPPREEGSGP